MSRRSGRGPSDEPTRETTRGKAARLDARPTTDYRLVNSIGSRLGNLVPALIRQPPLVVLVLGLLLYFIVLLLFAVIFWLIGPDCYELGGASFSFLEMTWLSVHTISSVGYGSFHPTCASSQLVVSFESYCSVVVQAMVSAYVVFIFIRSRARIRFSKHCLISREPHDEELGETPLEVNFRLMRESQLAVRDAHIYVQARFLRPQPEGGSPANRRKMSITAGKSLEVRAELEVHPNLMSVLDYWHVVHRVTTSSPLWPIRHELEKKLRSVDVSLSAYDTAFQQEVKLYVHYSQEEMMHNYTFEDMESTHESPTGSVTMVDCAKLDKIVLSANREKQERRERRGSFGSVTGLWDSQKRLWDRVRTNMKEFGGSQQRSPERPSPGNKPGSKPGGFMRAKSAKAVLSQPGEPVSVYEA